MKKWMIFILLGTCVFVNANDSRTWSRYQAEVLAHQSSFEGWCTPKKALAMMNLIYEVNPKICVEIGVFGGASIYPTASALKYLGKGKVFAIDPWRNSDCLNGYESDNPNYIWWSEVDLERIYRGFLKRLSQFKLNAHCKVLRMTAEEALSQFEDNSIDILHVDGNHTEESALRDVQLYLPKVKKGGYIWFDDANWPTTLKARNYLSEHCEKDPMRSTNEYFLYRK